VQQLTLISGAYGLVIPAKRHRPVDKETGRHTSYIERLKCTLRQRTGRLGRKALSFFIKLEQRSWNSKKLENHISAILFLAHHYNASLAL
jgi:hypothetical protein